MRSDGMTAAVKYCSGCGEVKPISAFHRKTGAKDGLQTYCRVCKNARDRDWQQANPALVRKYNQRRRAAHPNLARDSARQYRKERPDRTRDAVHRYSRNHRDCIRIRERLRRQQDPIHRLVCNLRTRLSRAVRGKYKGGSAVRDLGCSIEELMVHLSSMFALGMSRDNYGQWQIDHIVPLASFDLTKPTQVKRACHYTNLQPLWAEDNARKGAQLVKVA